LQNSACTAFTLIGGGRVKFLTGLGLVLLTVARPATASPIVIDFEDQPDILATAFFPVSYQGVTWSDHHWLQYAPYEPNGYDPDGVNAIFAADVSGLPDSSSSFTFSDRVFAGASFSAPRIFDLNFIGSRVFFELYDDGSLVHTSADLNSAALVFLPSGYAGMVDEVRVVTLRNGAALSLMTPGGAAWIMDNVTFDMAAATEVPEPASLLLLGSGVLGLMSRRGRSRVR
jgi:PEP-CTERM motif